MASQSDAAVHGMAVDAARPGRSDRVGGAPRRPQLVGAVDVHYKYNSGLWDWCQDGEGGWQRGQTGSDRAGVSLGPPSAL
eukprot:CAMPEP_0119422984 /NCGR_PEP_ID=MMETSP1335-20130426/29327_1 /TAXON_ID=259385 /ORGANISM="Chrysoculter rhomboideus, Strain RCC1486" /LENGTH=79 /DNA_ID=CAMNT_0007448457 /DNA_START=210 /DNA_END=450 /DNA_ORIENTATION=-